MTPNVRALLGVAKDLNVSQMTGVYVLLSEDRVVYVGQSINVIGRVLTHQRNLTFDKAVWFELHPDDLNAFEGALTRALNPRWGYQAPADDSRDAEILASLGLQADADSARRFGQRVTRKYRTAARKGQEKIRRRLGRVSDRQQKARRDRLFAGLTAMLAARDA